MLDIKPVVLKEFDDSVTQSRERAIYKFYHMGLHIYILRLLYLL